MTTSRRTRDSYHHGDLRNALVKAAAALAEQGGPDAVTVRAAAREVGVTPTAAYRHFSGQTELLDAARQAALDGMSAAMTRYISTIPEDGDPGDLAVAGLQATGRGYVEYALAEPGLFRTAFCPVPPAAEEIDEAAYSGFDVGPYALLTQMLDRLVEVGRMAPARRPYAEIAAWAGVHGLAMLLLDGPLAGVQGAERDQVIEAALDIFTHGLTGG